MCFVPKRCNDMMNVGRLQGFEVRLTHSVSVANISEDGLKVIKTSLSPLPLFDGLIFTVVSGQNHSPGQTAPARHLHCQWAGQRLPVPSQGKAGLPVWAAGDLQRANRQEERFLNPWIHFQKQHQGEPPLGQWTHSTHTGLITQNKITKNLDKLFPGYVTQHMTLHTVMPESDHIT